MSISLDMDIDKIVEKKYRQPTKRVFSTVVKRLYTMLSSDVAQSFGEFGSPTVSGRFRSSHRVSLNTIDTSFEAEVPEGQRRGPRTATNATRSALKAWKPGDTVFISNSLDYARIIESFGWSQFKTPDGVFKVTVEALKNEFSGPISLKVSFNDFNRGEPGG